jgi:hypothetical protein
MVIHGVEAEAGAAVEAGAPDPDQWRYDFGAERAAGMATVDERIYGSAKFLFFEPSGV